MQAFRKLQASPRARGKASPCSPQELCLAPGYLDKAASQRPVQLQNKGRMPSSTRHSLFPGRRFERTRDTMSYLHFSSSTLNTPPHIMFEPLNSNFLVIDLIWTLANCSVW